MNILLTGGTGFIGTELLKHLSPHKVVVLTRNIEKAQKKLSSNNSGNITFINSLNQYIHFDEFDAIINLAGEPITGKRWSREQKEKICNSRWTITEKLVELIHASANPPSIFISGSAVGYYGDQQNNLIDESLQINDQGFTYHVCSKWESIALQAQSQKTRVCTIRTGLVLGLGGGALPMMLPPFKFAAGSQLGNGKQYMPWIHLLDMVRGIIFLLQTPNAQGAFNVCSEHPVTNKEFSKILAATVNRPLFLVTPKWVFNIAMGEASCLLFDSIRARPIHLLELGFKLTYPKLQPALQNLLQ